MNVEMMSMVHRVVAAGCALIAMLLLPTGAGAAGCPNEAVRTGRSASLPDCRAYELVTPPELGRTGDMSFLASSDSVQPSVSGDALELDAQGSYLGSDVHVKGTTAVFSRGAGGWSMRSLVPAGQLQEDAFSARLLSPDLSHTAFDALDVLTNENETLGVGPAGGPYAPVASLHEPFEELQETELMGANKGTPAVPAMSDVLFSSWDHALLPLGPEREVAEETQPGDRDLYEWAGGRLSLVNVDSEGRLLNPCGAQLGAKGEGIQGSAVGAVSRDGSRVVFSSPDSRRKPGCLEPALFMRVDGRETVEVSEPQGVTVPPSAREVVLFDGASADGSRVFFTTLTALTPAAESVSGPKLYEYDVARPVGERLKLIGGNVAEASRSFVNSGVVVAEGGGAVYFAGECGICRYDTVSEQTSFVAVPQQPTYNGEPWSVSPDGRFFLFPSGNNGEPPVLVAGGGGLVPELRGAGRDQLYRYSAVDGSVVCVSCGEGAAAPAKGQMTEIESADGTRGAPDEPASALAMSSDGGRVFFQSNARLVARDTNESTPYEEDITHPGEGYGNGEDVYEWEAPGVEESPGVFCHVAVGCTHLLSTGEGVGPERFLAASEDGRNVFLLSGAQLVPGATPEFSNIYDVRVDGGFPSSAPVVECSSGCQGVGVPSVPSPGVPASAAFSGAGNPPLLSAAASSAGTAKPGPLTRAQKLASILKACRKRYPHNRRARGSCERRARGLHGKGSSSGGARNGRKASYR